jgi:hypothetical protein
MSTPEIPTPFESYEVTVEGRGTYRVLAPDAPDAYRLEDPVTKQVISLLCADSSEVLDAETLAALLDTPPPAPVLRQTTSVVINRMTSDEKAAIRACTVPQIMDAYDVALSEGIISEADLRFPTFRDALHGLGVVNSARWATLLAP